MESIYARLAEKEPEKGGLACGRCHEKISLIEVPENWDFSERFFLQIFFRQQLSASDLRNMSKRKICFLKSSCLERDIFARLLQAGAKRDYFAGKCGKHRLFGSYYKIPFGMAEGRLFLPGCCWGTEKKGRAGKWHFQQGQAPCFLFGYFPGQPGKRMKNQAKQFLLSGFWIFIRCLSI